MFPVPVPLPSPYVNGNRWDYSSVEVSINGFPLLGQEIVSISYKSGLKPEGVYGTSPKKLGRTRGRYEADGSLEVTKESYQLLIAALSQDPTRGYMEVPFVVTVNFQDGTGPLNTDTLVGCRITEDDDSHKVGAEGLTVRIALDIMSVERNGFAAVGQTTLI